MLKTCLPRLLEPDMKRVVTWHLYDLGRSDSVDLKKAKLTVR